MDDYTLTPLDRLIAQAYAQAYAHHGDFGLTAAAFSSRLHSIVGRRAGAPAPSLNACEFISRLYLDDLYLSSACTQGSDAAWRCFASHYGAHIRRVSLAACRSKSAAHDLADSLLGHIFLPDATGHCRMASYEGLSPLSAWLAAIIRHRALNECRLKAGAMESLDLLNDMPDESSIRQAEAGIRAGRYRCLINDSFADAVGLLSHRERLILHLRYGQQMQVREVARLLDVKPPAISRQIDRTLLKLRERVTSTLSTKHRLGPAIIQDCLTHLVENPEYGALDFG
jgi:RNA polymerase sigma factor (sigma-70 family)